MATITLKNFTFDKEQLEQEFASVMTQTLQTLFKQGLVDHTKGQEFLDTHTVLVINRDSLLDRLRGLLFSNIASDKSCTVKIVKVREATDPKPTPTPASTS